MDNADYIKTFRCGCKIVCTTTRLSHAEIYYCPKHKAAPEMYEALRYALPLVVNEWEGTSGVSAGNRAIALIEQALAKARGGI